MILRGRAMAESVTPQNSPARERLEASVAGVSHTVSDVVGALLDNLPLVLEAAEEAEKVERLTPGRGEWNPDAPIGDSTWRLYR